jgi:hypothetical protein
MPLGRDLVWLVEAILSAVVPAKTASQAKTVKFLQPAPGKARATVMVTPPSPALLTAAVDVSAIQTLGLEKDFTQVRTAVNQFVPSGTIQRAVGFRLPYSSLGLRRNKAIVLVMVA